MPRLPKGQTYTRLSGGDLVYMLRFRANGYPRSPIELGRRSQGLNLEQANGEAAVIAALIRRGEWQPARPERRPAASAAPTTFAAACAKLLADKEGDGVSDATLADYRSKIEVHLLPGIGPSTPITAIGDQMLDEYVGGIRAHNDAIREANRLAKTDPGICVPRRPPTTREIERWGGERRPTQKLKPISKGEIIRHLELLSQILRYYVVKTKELDEDPVGVWDRRPKRKRDHDRKPDWMLQPDEIVSLLAASTALDADRCVTPRPRSGVAETASLRCQCPYECRTMMSMATRTKRIEMRADPLSQDRISRAARAQDVSISAFVLSAATREADRILARTDRTLIPAAQFDALIEALDQGYAPDRLQRAVRDRRRFRRA